MDLELRISQYIDGELSGEEEGELHHMLAVSPEARALFREHLTLHTVARDERVLHRPTQSMRDDLFARLQAEEGLEPSALPFASAAGGAAIASVLPELSGSVGKAVSARPPVAAHDDPRAEDRRRRRRLIPIFIPLLLCVIVGGVWYGGGFGGVTGGNDGSGNSAIAESKAIGTEQKASVELDQKYAEPHAVPEIEANTYTQSRASNTRNSVGQSGSRSTSSHRGAAAAYRSGVQPEMELLAMSSANEKRELRESHDVLGIAPPNAMVALAEPAEDLRNQSASIVPANGYAKNGGALGEARFLAEERTFNLNTGNLYDNRETSSSFQSNLSAAFQSNLSAAMTPPASVISPAKNLNPAQSLEDHTSLSAASANSVGIAADDLDQAQGVAVNAVAPDSDPFFAAVRSGRLADSSTGLPFRATLENYDAVAAMLEQSGLDADGDGETVPHNNTPNNADNALGGSNTGNRAISERLSGTLSVENTWGANSIDIGAEGRKGANAPPVVMSDKNVAVQSDSLASVSAVVKKKEPRDRDVTTLSTVNAEAQNALFLSSSDDSTLDPATPRRIRFFVGLDQSVAATVNAVEVSLPSPTPTFASRFDGNQLFPETRALVGIDFDGGRQRAFVVIGAGAYSKQMSIQSETTTTLPGSGVVDRVTTMVREENKTVYEVWGGIGYRYSIQVAHHWNAGAEAWGGIGENYMYAGLAIPFSYELKENLRVEFSPGLRSRVLHSNAEPVTTGTPASGNYQEQIITPRHQNRVDASFGIGLILLLR